MSYARSPYRHFISPAVKGPAVILLLLLQCFVLGITAATASRLASFYGIEPATVNWFAQINAVGSVAVIPIYYRLRLYLKKTDLLLTALLGEMCLSFLCYTLHYAPVMLAGNFFLGMLKMVCMLDFIGLLVARYRFMQNRALFYALVYSITKPGAELAGILVNPLLEASQWQLIYLIAAMAALCCIVLCTLLFHNQRLHRKVPLYQVDWPGAWLFTGAALCFCYVLCFGKTKDWFEDASICYACLAVIVLAACFVYRQYKVKRPYWNLRVFSLRQVPLGVCFMLVMYLFYSTQLLLNQYAGYNFREEETSLSQLSVVTLCAYLASFPVTGILLSRGLSKRWLLCLAFLLYGGSLFVFSGSIQTSLSLYNLLLPYFLQGMAYGILLTTLSTFTATNVPRSFNGDRVFSSLAGRYVAGSAAGTALYSNWLFRNTVIHKQYLAEQLNGANPALGSSLQQSQQVLLHQGMNAGATARAAFAALNRQLEVQAMLVATREILVYAGLLALATACIVLFVRRFGMHEIAGRNRYKIV
jgi:DHA2 family multidrug resistance protein